ncbi:MAG: hypothetical protein NC253_01775 [Ruminococcus sp.]|nr:hypothetical protein [Ruminococcus sp.]MCM1381206.1 hypothetical protein [Muribaculaceae bacterium]MCM1478724.1 hypothetical protein [Muribaculaceae bacterium]
MVSHSLLKALAAGTVLIGGAAALKKFGSNEKNNEDNNELANSERKSQTSEADMEKYIEAEDAADFAPLTDEELLLYVPDVYQKSIFDIEFDRLKENGIKFLSFDIDDTIIGLENRFSVPEETKDFFNNLKKDFTVILFSNGSHKRVEFVGRELGVKGIARACKPDIEAFKKMQAQFGFAKSEMAHIGNNLIDDARGGNAFGIITCIVRRKGRLTNIPSSFGYTGGKYLRAVLLDRDIWRKHHKYERDDQYYQLDSKPLYRYHR